MIYFLDTSSIIEMFVRTYPYRIFPSLYDQVSNIQATLILYGPIRTEFRRVYPKAVKEASRRSQRIKRSPLYQADHSVQGKYPLDWMIGLQCVERRSVQDRHKVTRDELMRQYGIVTKPGRSTGGASGVDCLLIAAAQQMDAFVVTEEEDQDPAPKNVSKSKIPLICAQQGVGCTSLLGMFERTGIRV